jgi:hypothetical protein
VAAGCGKTGGDRREEEAEVSLRGSGRCALHQVFRRDLDCELTEPCCLAYAPVHYPPVHYPPVHYRNVTL